MLRDVTAARGHTLRGALAWTPLGSGTEFALHQAQRINNGLNILWKIRTEGHFPLRSGVFKGQACCMKRLAVEAFQRRTRRAAQHRSARLEPCALDLVS